MDNHEDKDIVLNHASRTLKRIINHLIDEREKQLKSLYEVRKNESIRNYRYCEGEYNSLCEIINYIEEEVAS